jgi:hypothetical protein
MSVIATMRWERLDVPGTDECRVLETDSGYRLEGLAEYSEQGEAHKISYAIDCAKNWDTWRATIEGTANHVIERKSRLWTLNGVAQEMAGNVTQIDFGFSAATKFLQLKQMNLAVGQDEHCVVAWFDLFEEELVYLHQIYERKSDSQYGYECPSYKYDETLDVNDQQFVTTFPRLWRSV